MIEDVCREWRVRREILIDNFVRTYGKEPAMLEKADRPRAIVDLKTLIAKAVEDAKNVSMDERGKSLIGQVFVFSGHKFVYSHYNKYRNVAYVYRCDTGLRVYVKGATLARMNLTLDTIRQTRRDA
ncbi:hypothetical protein IPV08_15945 [Methylobacterium sp. SD274]|uniref:hypothetical protein n=1 Tax=Methylobacterium sp. SD274 TaxID=2782009 RepID=UPI001A97C97C|nr:hypothetical protein [Methylobacterium sp. SD274]MBO1021454.1 hypothetical protein [Methylobacterium sp. SD274]